MRRAYLILILVSILAISIPASLASMGVPDWIRQTALLYGEGTISDDTFLGAMQYLVDEGLLKVDAPAEPEPNPDHTIPSACDTLCNVKEPDNTMACWASCSLLEFEFEFEDGWFDGYPETDVVSGHVTRVIDGNTIVIDGIKIRSPFIDVVDSGNSTTTHAKLAKALCPVGSKAHYNVDDWQPVGHYGRTIALVYCDGVAVSIDQIMMLSGNGWVNQKYCHLSEFASLEWVRCQE